MKEGFFSDRIESRDALSFENIWSSEFGRDDENHDNNQVESRLRGDEMKLRTFDGRFLDSVYAEL